MSTHKKSRAREPGLMDIVRDAAGQLIEERDLYTNLDPGAARDEALRRAAGAAAVLHGVLPSMSRPGCKSPRNLGVQLTAEQGRPASEVNHENRLDEPVTSEELLGDMAIIGAGAYIEAVDMEPEYA